MRFLAFLVVVLASCVVGDEGTPGAPPATEPPVEEPPPGMFGVVTEPRHGQVVAGSTATAAIRVAGVHEQADYQVAVQVLDDPRVATSWTTIGSALTTRTPNADGLYAWSVTVGPTLARWPEGGVLRMRVVGESSEQLALLYHDSDDCIATMAPLRNAYLQCSARVKNGMVLVSSSLTPADVVVRSPFLDRRGTSSITETQEYYAATNAPTTLAEFRTRFGFDAPHSTSTFYNAGDLGIGREMHCRAQTGGGVACYVSNYGEFGGDPGSALASTIAGVEAGGTTGSFATVAMVYTPPITAPNAVSFVVYDGAGAIATQAQLDTFGDNMSIPNNCINCHGGARYDAAQNAVIGARFLPFDPSGFEFAPARAGYRDVDQFPRIHELNQLIAQTEPTPAIREMIEGFGTAPSRPALDFVPAGWSATTASRKVYTETVAVACRSCHTSLTGALDFRTAESFESFRTQIADSLCGPSGLAASHDMPSAEVPLRRLWTTPARAYLVDFLDITGACEP